MLFSRIFGQTDAPHLVVLHGLFGMSDNWVRLSKKWAETYCVHLIDLRNHGQSPHHDQMDYRLMSQDVYQYIQHHRLQSVYLIGHSMGGKVAMCTAVRYPDVISKLIVADILPKQYPYKYKKIVEGLQTIPVSDFTRRTQADEYLQPFIPDDGERVFILKNVYRRAEGGYGIRCNVEGISANMHHLLRGWDADELCHTETLFIRGGRSRYIPLEDVDCIATHFSSARLETIDDAGHWLHADAPEEFMRIVGDFLD